MILNFRKRSALSRITFARATWFALATSVAMGGATALAAVPRSAATGTVVPTQYGPVVGRRIENMRAFLGIPYAAPPVGALRWRPPEPHAQWTAPRSATSFAPHCAQSSSFLGAFGIATTNEDCLYLNVFTPEGARNDARLPVMFYIHGGALITGESDDYNPGRLVERGVVVVTINYRLGLLGFLAQSGLDAEGHLFANYGLLDQQSALAWVQRNIQNFGGDPARTTVFGESAGGQSVLSNVTSPRAAGLFRAAIVESGAFGLSLPTLASAETAGNGYAAALGCATPACLRSVSVSKILAVPLPSVGVYPTVDGTILPLSNKAALAAGHFNRVPIINGSNSDEWRLVTALGFDLTSGPLTAAAYPNIVTAGFGPNAPAVLAAYPLSAYPSPDLAYATYMTSTYFGCPAFEADTFLSNYVPTFAYEFADEKAPQAFLPPVSYPYGAAHASELQFLFNHSTAFSRPSPPLSAAEHQLAETMVRDWTDFAKGQEPWHRFSMKRETMQRFVAPEPYMFDGFSEEHNCALFAYLAGP